ncbi:hypothetical protein NUU61_002911 [Penicillium alfredii]|uniref:Uncharacterized protein n=1 Tax=Penicillium alfredii TaxID=1506179 RepID=A0A9W9FSF0_9EURO|nr:uncharacterized protein NUU61_002911 [Penicillium alfredii]KAJ5105564.1 hypothetical protein NUU61_002911 [Penicillium alfredii]
MSAPRSGRQSPPEERQSGAQQRDPPGSGKANLDGHPPPAEFPQQRSDEEKSRLPSNPEHPLEKIEAAKFAK